MIQLSAELLALSSEPALIVKGGKILFANDAARSMLGTSLTQKSFAALFGKDIAGVQASSFVAETEAAGRRVLLRIKALEGMRVVFLSSTALTGELLGDAFLYALRSELMQLGVSTSMLRAGLRPEDTASSSALRGVILSLYRVNRTLQNLSIIRGAENDSLLFRPQPLELSSLLRDLFDSVRVNLPKPEIRFSASGEMPVQGDPELLETLTLNLLSNCLRHAEGCTRVRVHLHGAGEHVILSVDDDGCGIPGDRLHTVLERYRFNAGLCDLERGPGFGLTAVRHIARLHGGTLLLESRENVGTAVRVSLNRSPRPLTPLQAAEPEYNRDYDTILTGLAGCLPVEAYDLKDT